MNDICISITFSEILIKPQETKQVTVTYEYTAVSIVKKEQDPFSDKIYNTIIYTIDNSNRDLII